VLEEGSRKLKNCWQANEGKTIVWKKPGEGCEKKEEGGKDTRKKRKQV